MIEGPIVDSHVHLADASRFTYGWMDSVPALRRNVLPADFATANGPYEVDRFVFVEVDVAPGQQVDEARWVAALAADDPRIGAIVASLPLENGAAVSDELDVLADMPLVTSIRRLIQNQPDPNFCVQPGFLEGLGMVADKDLAFDICVLHHQLPAVIEMVRRSPNVRFVLDHIGKPGIKAGLFDPWRDDMRTLAAFDNVWCKVSGVVTEADHASWTAEEVRPYIEHTLDCFGFERAMFGGDWHVLELAGTYPGWVEVVAPVVASASADERRRFWRDNATAFYRIAR
ncbi:MAG: amidohydrolase [Acuticoccus sp.]